MVKLPLEEFIRRQSIVQVSHGKDEWSSPDYIAIYLQRRLEQRFAEARAVVTETEEKIARLQASLAKIKGEMVELSFLAGEIDSL